MAAPEKLDRSSLEKVKREVLVIFEADGKLVGSRCRHTHTRLGVAFGADGFGAGYFWLLCSV